MKLREQILEEHSKANCDIIVAWVGDSQQRFDELFRLFTSDEYRVVQRAGWPLSYLVEQHPKFIQKHFKKLIQYLQQPGTHNAVRRNIVRLLQHVKVPESSQGTVMDLCFGFIADPKEKAAVKAFALTVLDNLSQQYPEIKAEIIQIIEDRWEYETAAFHSRAKKILKSNSR